MGKETGKEIGIDLGTTNTVVCYVNKKGFLRPLRIEGRTVIPSAVYFTSENEFVIGEQARKRGQMNPDACVMEFKSRLKERIRIRPEKGSAFRYAGRKVASIFLNQIINRLEAALIREFGPEEGCIGSVVITVPAKFNDAEKDAVKWAALDAGFTDVRLATEPTAAAVAHRHENGQEGRTVLVYDFGGGTFDVSIIQESRNRFVEIATGGDKTLGGNRLRNRMAEYLLALVNDEYGIELPFSEDEFDEDVCEMSLVDYQLNRWAILEEADRVKEALSEDDEELATINLRLPGGGAEMFSVTITRKKLEALVRDDVQRTIAITRGVFREAQEQGIEAPDWIVLAGGSAQLPMVKRLMEEEFGQVIYADDVSTLIARGAALLASEELSNVTEPATNIRYGAAVRQGVAYGLFRTIIEENQRLPCSGEASFYLNRDGQQRLEIPYYEWDIKNYPDARTTADDGISLIDTLVIPDLPEGLRKDEVTIRVVFSLQLDGTLEVRAEVFQAGAPLRKVSVQRERDSNLS